jgi:hypothetical protein
VTAAAALDDTDEQPRECGCGTCLHVAAARVRDAVAKLPPHRRAELLEQLAHEGGR